MRLQHWILRFVGSSGELRLMVEDFVEWLANRRPPWSSYQALISGILVTLENQPGIRTVRMGETWHRLMAKCVLQVTGQKFNATYEMDHLVGG